MASFIKYHLSSYTESVARNYVKICLICRNKSELITFLPKSYGMTLMEIAALSELICKMELDIEGF